MSNVEATLAAQNGDYLWTDSRGVTGPTRTPSDRKEHRTRVLANKVRALPFVNSWDVRHTYDDVRVTIDLDRCGLDGVHHRFEDVADDTVGARLGSVSFSDNGLLFITFEVR